MLKGSLTERNTSTMKKRITNTSVLVALVSITIGCTGQPGSTAVGDVPVTQAAAVPFHTGLSYLNEAPTEIAFDVDNRFILTVTKEKLHAAKTIYDIVPGDPKVEVVSYSSVSIRTYVDEQQTDIVEIGDRPELTPAQRELLRSLDYSSNFLIRAEFRQKSGETGQTSWNYASPHITIVPEKQAVNSDGKEAMIAHVKKGTSGFGYMVDANTLRSGKINFTVTQDGTLSDVHLTSSSGYAALDERVIQLVNTLPGSWEPATNAAGEKVEQEFVFSFGTVGC